jgi:nucleotide-binding universal stress UspA family protein
VKYLAQNRFKNILVPIDGSTSCLRARELTAIIARKFNSKITLVHVVSHDFMHPEHKANYQLPPEIMQKIDAVYMKAGEKILRTAEEVFKEEGLQVEPILIRRAEDPADSILNLSKERLFDLIIMGNRAETHAEPFELGSTSEKIALYSKIPVLIVKKKTKLGKILVAIDGSKQATKALGYVSVIARKFNSKVTLLHVAESKLANLEPEAVKKISEKILFDAATEIKDVEIQKGLVFGNPAESIIQLARKENYDLIVLGSRGLSSVKRYLLGSVSEDVTWHARRSVLIVR